MDGPDLAVTLRMLIDIRRAPFGPAKDEIDDLLLACHRRIRRFSGLALRLGEPGPGGDGDNTARAEAAAAVQHYFDVALPLHAADEDESLRPRLLAAGVSAPVERALAVMEAEHRQIDLLLTAAIPLWRELAQAPERHGVLRPALLRIAQPLDQLFLQHLQAEENIIFPILHQVLDAEALGQIRHELRQRRGS